MTSAKVLLTAENSSVDYSESAVDQSRRKCLIDNRESTVTPGIVQFPLMLQLKNNTIRDESSPRAPIGLSDLGAERAPSERDLRAAYRERLRQEQAPEAKIVSAPMNSPVDVESSSSSTPVVHLPVDSNPSALSAINPSSNLHSQPLAAGSVPLGAEVNTDPTIPLMHTSRESNLTNFTQDKLQKLKLPPSSDAAAWKLIDDELSVALPIVFTDQKIKSLSSTALSQKFDKWLYDFFVERFGVQADIENAPKPHKSFQHRGLERLRKKKKECRAALRTLRAAGHRL
jgi:hypothetical protein